MMNLGPSCRDLVLEARKNPNINNIIDKYLAVSKTNFSTLFNQIQSHPDKKRSQAEYTEMGERNKFITADKIQISVPKKDEVKNIKKMSESESESEEEE